MGVLSPASIMHPSHDRSLVFYDCMLPRRGDSVDKHETQDHSVVNSAYVERHGGVWVYGPAPLSSRPP